MWTSSSEGSIAQSCASCASCVKRSANHDVERWISQYTEASHTVILICACVGDVDTLLLGLRMLFLPLPLLLLLPLSTEICARFSSLEIS